MPLTLDITPLRSFSAVCTFGGFRRAAVALSLTQSAVSRHIAILEQTTGRTLFDRRGRHIELTHEGRELQIDAERILATHDAAVARYAQPAPEMLTVASADHVADELLPDLIAQIRELLPAAQLLLRTGRGPELRTAVERGEIDIAVVFTELTHEAEYGVPLQWIASPSLHWNDDRRVPLVTFQHDNALKAAALTALTDNDYTPVLVGEAPDLAGVHALVRAGTGVALLPLPSGPPVRTATVPHLPQAPSAVLDLRLRPGLSSETARALQRAGRTALASRRRP